LRELTVAHAPFGQSFPASRQAHNQSGIKDIWVTIKSVFMQLFFHPAAYCMTISMLKNFHNPGNLIETALLMLGCSVLFPRM